MRTLDDYKKLINQYIESNPVRGNPSELYEPIEYILTLDGKRLRPALVLASSELFSQGTEEAMPVAIAVEIFHNFTLMHDDIMDRAPLRRGNQTVHEKWDVNTAILSGDVMLIKACQMLLQSKSENITQLLAMFHHTAVQVCEGQQMDMNFEKRDQVDLSEYIEMIRLKTAVLLAAGLQMGAITGGASLIEASHLYSFGENIGIAFQLQDDYLDVFGNPEKFGKQVAGDILTDKKTFLQIKLQELIGKEDLSLLEQYKKANDPQQKISGICSLYKKYEVDSFTLKAVQSFAEKAMESLNTLKISTEKKQFLFDFGKSLLHRQH